MQLRRPAATLAAPRPRAGRLGNGSRPIGATTRQGGSAGAAGTRLRGNAVTVLSMATWATTFPLTDILLETWHPLPATAARLVAAVPFLWLMLALQGRLGELRRAPWGQGFRVGGLGLAGAALFIVLGIAFSDPLTVAIVAATVPLTSAVIGVAARTERLTRPVAAGLALAVAGAVVVALRGTGGGGFDLLGGEIFVVAANVCWVWYSRGCVLRLSRLSDLAKTAVTTTCAAAVVGAVVGLGLAAGLVPPRLEFSAASIGLVLWLAAVANGVSIVLWLAGARMLGVTIGSMHQNLVPVYVAAMIVPLGGEITAWHAVGGVLVVAGAVLAQLPAARRGHGASV